MLTDRKILVSLALFVLLFSGLLFYEKAGANIPEHVTIVRTEDGFYPWKVLIKKGGAVTFKSETGKEYWPASDFHPTHTRNPEFDPKRPVAPEEEWTFTFDKAGAWKFHDHLAHEFTGVILVAGNEDEEIESCLEKTSKQVLQPECWEVTLFKTLATEGLDAALVVFSNLHKTDPTFRDNCHVAAHLFGNAAYVVFEKEKETVTESPELFFCNNGFFHGFFKSMSKAKGYKNFDEILLYCRKLGESNAFPSPQGARVAERACLFGLGKTIMRNAADEARGSPEVMVEKSIKHCGEMLPTNFEREGCAYGIFNELGLDYVEKNFDLAFGPTPPTHLCEGLPLPYEKPCFMELTVMFTAYKKMSFEKALETVQNLPSSQAQISAFQFFIQYAVEYGLFPEITSKGWPTVCSELENGEWQNACISGAIRGFSGRGILNQEYEEMFTFCDGFSEERGARHLCFLRSIERITPIYSPEKLSAICKKLPLEYQKSCTPIR